MRRGSRISKTHAPDYGLITTVMLLIVIGLVMLSSASAAISYDKFGTNNYYLLQQLGPLGIGLVLMFLVARMDYHKLSRLAVPLLYLTLGLLVVVFIPGIGFGYGGAQRWISWGPIFLQPSEIAKITFLIYLATWLDKRGKGVEDFKYGLLPFLTLLGVIGILIMMQPDLGTMFIIAISSIIVYFIAGAQIGHLVLIGIGSLGLFGILIKIAPYRLARFTTYLHPELDPQGIGYQINQALLAVGSGGILGLGLGKSRQKFNYLPEATGDSIFAIIAEELGFIRTTVLVLLFLFLAYKGFKIAKEAPDMFGKLLAVGITSWLSFQAIINIAAIINLLPLTGIPLPFISYGGSALVISMIGVGILISISRYTKASNQTSWRRS
ncbi:MAG: putative lipid II flippase FtsW [bacterium]